MKNRNYNMHNTQPGMIVRYALIPVFGMLMTAASAVLTSVSAQELEEKGEALPPLYTNQVELGVIYSSQDSAKFGQYNGLNESGIKALGNLIIRGSDGTLRWNLLGNNLGTTSRTISGLLSIPGQWEIKASYDGLDHYITDSYQTPLLGNLGDNNFTLPANFGSVNANHSGTDAPFDTNSTRLLSAAQLGDFNTQVIHSDRNNASFGAEYIFNDNWSAKLDYNHLQQSGAKLIGTGNQGGITLLGGNSSRAEANNILMNPTEFTTDTLSASFIYQADNAYLSLGYYGSLFDDRYNSLSWQASQRNSLAPACVGGVACYTNNTMSTAPDNEFHQFNLSGAYLFSPTTRVVGGFSYGVNTQNDSYAPTLITQANATAFNMMQANGLPVNSLNGEVDNVHSDLKITNQFNRDLLLSASFNYNERDNQTTSKTYLYKIISNSNYIGVNLPYSNRTIQAKAEADYRLSSTQKVHVRYEHDFIDRWCDGVVGGLQCVSTPNNDDDIVDLSYRARVSETINVNAGYNYTGRSASFADYAANFDYPAANGDDKLGWHTHIFDSREQHTVRAGADWQASDKVDFMLKGRYSENNYDSTLGVQNGTTGNINLDATYQFTEKGTISAYGSWQTSQRDLRSGNGGSITVAPTNIWTNQLKQDSYAVGLNAKRSGLQDGKLELMGDLSYSFDTSHYSTQVPYNAGCSATTSYICGDTPDITTSLITLKLSGNYKVNDKGKVAATYIYQVLDSNDYYYNIYQYGYTSDRMIPTNEKAPNYDAHLIMFSYIYSF